MKVKVALKIKTCSDFDATLDVTAGPSDTVLALKERIMMAQVIPFPDQEMSLVGSGPLADASRLADAGVCDGSELELHVKAGDGVLAGQLSELLQARDLSADELGLLYCYKHGASISQALKLLGHSSGKLQDFMKGQKKFQLENGRVALVREDTALKPFSTTDEIVRMLKASGGTMDIKDLCAKFSQKFNVNLASIVGMRPGEFLAKEREVFIVSGKGSVTLKSMLAEQAKQKKESKAPAAATQAPPPGLVQNAPPGLAGEALKDHSVEIEQYAELHNRISSRSFNSKISQTLTELVDLVQKNLPFQVDHVVKGGSAGKGTAISGKVDAEAVFFLSGLPLSKHDMWLPPLLRAASGVLTEHLKGQGEAGEVRIIEDVVQLQAKDMTVDFRFSPVFENYTHAIKVLGEQPPEARKYYAAALSKESTQFIARQPGLVKATMRLLKWWRDQQQWSSKLTYPSDEVLELMAVYSTV